MTRSGRASSEGPWRLPAWLSIALMGLALVRLGAAVLAATRNTHGDYYASMPGPYVRTLNPVLWDSADLQGAWGYHALTYFHGPTQYLTLYPMAWLDSYAAIAALLLPVYVVLLGLTFLVLLRALTRLAPDQTVGIPLFAAMFLFFPLLQSLIQREFEVVALFGLACALWMLVQDRKNAAAAILAYVAWFKYIPLSFAAYLAWRGWWKAVAAFAIATLVILGVAQALFGLPLFFNNNVPGHAAQVLALTESGFRVDEAGHLIGLGFCNGWFDTETTLANVRHGLCTLGAHARWLPPHLIYVAICLSIAIAFLVTHARLQRRALAQDTELWRRALEVSIVTTVCACFFFSHYYYLVLLVIPFSVLLVRYLSLHDSWSLAAWGASYFSVSAFIIPTGILSRLAGVDVWEHYMWGAWFLYGELLLMWLLLREYGSLTR